MASVGSGSWDPIIGLGLKRKLNNSRSTITLRSSYKFTTINSVGYNFGDFNTSVLQYQHEFGKINTDSTCSENSNWNKTGIVGVINDFIQAQALEDLLIEGTGYNRMYLTIGGALSRKQIVINGYLDLPLYEKVSGPQNTSKMRARLALQIKLN